MSKIGIPRARAGSARATRAVDFETHVTLAAAMVKSMNKLPQSSIKTLAGLKLKNRKPDRLPSRDKANSAIITSLSRISPVWIVLPWMARMAITPQAIAVTPAASPSNPSLMLTAFVTPTIHRMVIGQASPPKRWQCPHPD